MSRIKSEVLMKYDMMVTEGCAFCTKVVDKYLTDFTPPATFTGEYAGTYIAAKACTNCYYRIYQYWGKLKTQSTLSATKLEPLSFEAKKLLVASNKVHQAKGNDSAYVRNSEGLIMPTGSYKSIDDGLYYVGHRTMDLESVEKMQPIWAMRWARCKETFIHDTCVQLGIPYEPL